MKGEKKARQGSMWKCEWLRLSNSNNTLRRQTINQVLWHFQETAAHCVCEVSWGFITETTHAITQAPIALCPKCHSFIINIVYLFISGPCFLSCWMPVTFSVQYPPMFWGLHNDIWLCGGEAGWEDRHQWEGQWMMVVGFAAVRVY